MKLHKVDTIKIPKEAWEDYEIVGIKLSLPKEPEKKYGPDSEGMTYSAGTEISYSVKNLDKIKIEELREIIGYILEEINNYDGGTVPK